MNRLLSSIAILSLLPLFGCKDSGTGLSDDPFATLPGNYVEVPDNPIDTKIFYSFLENIDRLGKSVSVHFTSERIYGMGGYRIVSSLQRVGSQFTIHLDSILAPEAGIAILSPASAMFQLGPLSDGFYSFDLVVNGCTVRALLSVTDGSLLTCIQPNNIIVPSIPKLMRVPPTIIWGQAESITPFRSQNFLDSLQLLGATTASLPPGQYLYFTVNVDGSFDIPSNFGMAFGHHFLYRFDGDTSMTRSLVKRFAKRYPDSLYISLFGGRGEMYYTTVLRLEPWSSNGLTIQTDSRLFRTVDTVRFFVQNSGDRESELASCNARLSFFLQRLGDNDWHDHDSINIGPCVALYGPIAIAPGQTISGSFAVASLQSIAFGDYRMRIQYMLSGEPNWRELYSNSFQILD